jgi:hypothetical protein
MVALTLSSNSHHNWKTAFHAKKHSFYMTSYSILWHLGADFSFLGAKNALEGVIYPLKNIFTP